MIKCKICSAESSILFEALILKKIPTNYYKCNKCGFVQTDIPHWLDEAYSSAITKQDIGLINRNLTFSPLVSTVIKFFFKQECKFLDYGGGYGMFVRLMRDKGFDFYRFDTYCKNIFADGFDCMDGESFELLTAFEVFEHLLNPLEEIEKMLEKSKNIFFSTELQPDNFNTANDWWYVMPETGQHISLYSLETLNFIAKKYKLNLYTNGKTFHLLTEKKLNPLVFKFVTNWYILNIMDKIIKRRKSLLMVDYQNILKLD
jgi:hypothetical protein